MKGIVLTFFLITLPLRSQAHPQEPRQPETPPQHKPATEKASRSTLTDFQNLFRGFSLSPGVSLLEFAVRIEDKKKSTRSVMVNSLGKIGFHFNLYSPIIEIGPVNFRVLNQSSLFSIDRQHLETATGKRNKDLGSEITGYYSYLGPVFYLGPLGVGAGYGTLSLSGNAWFADDIQESSPRELREVSLNLKGVWVFFLTLEAKYKHAVFSLSAAALRTSTKYFDYDFDEGKLTASYMFTY